MLRRRQRVQFRPNVDASTSRPTDSEAEEQESSQAEESTDTNLQVQSSSEPATTNELEVYESIPVDKGFTFLCL